MHAYRYVRAGVIVGSHMMKWAWLHAIGREAWPEFLSAKQPEYNVFHFDMFIMMWSCECSPFSYTYLQ